MVLQVRGGVPPVATRVALYAAPIWPLGKKLVEMARGVGVVLPEEDELQPCRSRRLIKRNKKRAKNRGMYGCLNFPISVEYTPELGPGKLSVKTWGNTLTEVLEPHKRILRRNPAGGTGRPRVPGSSRHSRGQQIRRSG